MCSYAPGRVEAKLTAQARAVNRAESIHDARWSVNSKSRFSCRMKEQLNCVLFAQATLFIVGAQAFIEAIWYVCAAIKMRCKARP